MKEKGLESLVAWKQAIQFAVRVHKEVVPQIPESGAWVMGRQLRRSAQSIPANIAEAFGRFYYQDGIRHCCIARGSLEETRSHLYLARELGYIRGKTYAEFNQEIDLLRRMLSGYIAYLRRSRRGNQEEKA
ncbi:MAG: four helix bundle protein [Anaerolineales bacterium]